MNLLRKLLNAIKGEKQASMVFATPTQAFDNDSVGSPRCSRGHFKARTATTCSRGC